MGIVVGTGARRDRRPWPDRGGCSAGAIRGPFGAVRSVPSGLSRRMARAIWRRRKYGTVSIAAMVAWMIRLPAPGSM